VNVTVTVERIILVAMTFGLTLAAAIYFAAPRSGGHINPAVTFGLVLTKRVSILQGILYVIAQGFGATTGSALVKAGIPGAFERNLGANVVLAPFGYGLVWFWEIVGTFFLVMVVLNTVGDPDSDKPLPGRQAISAPLAIGFALLVLHLVMIPVDGTSVNPARSFGPALIANFWTDIEIFLVAPFCGSALASMIYLLFLMKRKISDNYEAPYA